MSVKETLIERGIYKLFEGSRYNYSPEPEESRVMSALVNMPDVLIPLCKKSSEGSSVRKDFLTAVYKHISDSDIDISSQKEWVALCKDVSLNIDEIEPSWVLNGHVDYAIEAATYLEDFDWESLFVRVYDAQKHRNYTNFPFHRILSKYAEFYSESFSTFVSDAVFNSKTKPSYVTRASLYSEYISQGLLTKKTARKMRSDGSSDASAAALKSLFDNSDKYENFDNLALQFSDSKYDEVICYLAKNLPEYLLTSIMGTQSHWGKVALEKRFRQIERERDANDG